MKQNIRILNDCSKDMLLGVGSFMPEDCRVVKTGQVIKMDLEVGNEETIFFKVWDKSNRLLIQVHDKEVWK